MKITIDRLKRISEGDIAEAQRMLDEHKQETIEAVLRSIPAMIGRLVEYTAGIHNSIAKFYTEFPDIEKHKDIVVATVKDVEQENAGKSVDELIELAKPIIFEKIDLLNKAKYAGSLVTETRLAEVGKGLSNGSI